MSRTLGRFECTARRCSRAGLSEARKLDWALTDHARLARGCTHDAECRWRRAALVRALLQPPKSLSARGDAELGATPVAACARPAYRAPRPLAHANRTGRNPDGDDALHGGHRLPAGHPHRSRVY